MAEIYTDNNSKSPTQLEKVGPSFSSLFSLARACVLGDIAPLRERLERERDSREREREREITNIY